MEKEEKIKPIIKKIIEFLGEYAILVGALAFLVAIGISVCALITVSGWELRLLALSAFIIALGGLINMFGSFWTSKKHDELEREKLNNQTKQFNIQKQELDNQTKQFKELERANRLQEQANKQNKQEIELLKKRMKVGRVIKMLRNFISPLISVLEEKIHIIDYSLSGQDFALSNFLIKIDYEYAHTDILGDKNYELVKEKIDEYNNHVRAERLKEAKGIGVDLKNRLEELEGEYMVNFDIPKEERKKDQSPHTVLRKGEVGVGHRQEPREDDTKRKL